MKEKVEKIITGNKKIKEKPKIKKILTLSLIIPTFFYLGIYSAVNYSIDNKISSIVTSEDVQNFKNTTSVEYKRNLIIQSLKKENYTDIMKKEDEQMLKNFNVFLKDQLNKYYEKNEFIKKDFPEYENNFELFLKDFKKRSLYDMVFPSYYMSKSLEKHSKYSFMINLYDLNLNTSIELFFSLEYLNKENNENHIYILKNYSDKASKIKEIIKNNDLFYDINFSDSYLINNVIKENKIFDLINEDYEESFGYLKSENKLSEEQFFSLIRLKTKIYKNNLEIQEIRRNNIKIMNNFNDFNYSSYKFINQPIIKINDVIFDDKIKYEDKRFLSGFYNVLKKDERYSNIEKLELK